MEEKGVCAPKDQQNQHMHVEYHESYTHIRCQGVQIWSTMSLEYFHTHMQNYKNKQILTH